MEFRQLEAFVTVATELHFGRAAQRLHMGQPTLSELIKRLERELGTPLLTRTTRRVALTGAGAELLTRSEAILAELAATTSAVRRIADGVAGTVRVGACPPTTPVLVPHLVERFAHAAPDVVVEVERMWLPILTHAVDVGAVDIAITCGLIPEPDHVVGEVFCGEPLQVGLRPDHPLAAEPAVSLDDLAGQVLGATRSVLFPAWSLAERQALQQAGIAPRLVELADTDLFATRWTAQPDVDWILTCASLSGGVRDDVVRPVTPELLVPYTLQWNPKQVHSAAAARLVTLALSTPPPPGWRTLPAHLEHGRAAAT